MDEELRSKYNLRSPSVKRLMREAMELKDASSQYHAQPLEDNLFEWHFTVRGPPDSDFDAGRYHGRIILPPEYPMKPPSIILLTPNGRFEIGKKICLSMSAHHPEGWQPSWSIRTVLLALIGFMPTKGGGAIAALDYTTQERHKLAQRSAEWTCEVCGVSNIELLPEVTAIENEEANKEAKELASQINFKGEAKHEANDSQGKKEATADSPPRNQEGNFQQPPNLLPGFYNPYYFPYQMPGQPGFVPPYAFNNRSQNFHQPFTPNAPVPDTPRQTEGDLLGSSPVGQSEPLVTNNSSTSDAIDAKDEPSSSAQLPNATALENASESFQRSQVEGSEPTQTRQRNVPLRETPAASQADGSERRSRRRHEDEGGYISLIMLWLVTISLVALILRRLCMEAMNLNPQT